MIKRQKKARWRDFFDNLTNIYKAKQCTKAASKSNMIPELRERGQVAQREEEKADLLISSTAATSRYNAAAETNQASRKATTEDTRSH